MRVLKRVWARTLPHWLDSDLDVNDAAGAHFVFLRHLH